MILTRGFGAEQRIILRGYGVGAERRDCFVTLHVSEVTMTWAGYALTLDVVDANELPLELFVFQREPSVSGAYSDGFSHVASLASIEEYPVGAPETGAQFYRRAMAEFVFRSVELMVQGVEDIKRDICQLVESAIRNLALTADTVEVT